MYKKESLRKENKNYLQDCLVEKLPILMKKVIQKENGKFVFEHPIFPDLRVEGVTMTFVQDNLERAIKKQLKNQSDKHVDYILALLLA